MTPLNVEYEGMTLDVEPVQIAPGQLPLPGIVREPLDADPPGMGLPVWVRVERSRNRRVCRRCGHRRACYSLTMTVFNQPAIASPWRCAPCAGLVLHGGRRS